MCGWVTTLPYKVWIHDGTSDAVDNYDLCARVENVQEIPSEGYFGISAATGGLSG